MHLKHLQSPNTMNWKVLKSLVERGERYANEFTDEIIHCF
jgi:hypothetical protein